MFALIQFNIDEEQETILGVFSAVDVQDKINQAAMKCAIGVMDDFDKDAVTDSLWVCLPLFSEHRSMIESQHHIRGTKGVPIYSGVDPKTFETGYLFYVREVKVLD